VFKSKLAAILAAFIIAGCSGSDEPKEPIEIKPEPVVSMPTKEVPVYPLGEPGLDNYFANLERDENGIILIDAHGNPETYEPGMIAKYVMATYRNYKKTNNEDILKDGLKHSDWLVDNVICNEQLGYWELEAPLDSLVVWESPFKSAMSNGLAIFALSQMLDLTETPEAYLSTIECALKAYQYDISENGVSTITDEYMWFEEYAMESRSKVLNGGLFALTGVWVAKEYLNSNIASELLDKMLAAVELRLNEYDYDHTTLYHTSLISGKYTDYGRPVHGQYNEIHALQLQWLYSFTGNELFLDYAKKFYTYESYEAAAVLRNGTHLPKLVDLYKYHSYEQFTSLDKFEVEMKPEHNLKEIHLFYYGYHTSLPEIAANFAETSVQHIASSQIRYFQDDNHHTSVGIYKVDSDVDIKDVFEINFEGYTYTDNYNRNLFRQVEIVTHDNDAYFDAKYEMWAAQGDWSREFK